MFCSGCGQHVPGDSVFCNRCGKPLTQKQSVTSETSSGYPADRGEQVRSISDRNTGQFFRPGPKVWILVVVLLLLLVALLSSKRSNGPEPTAPQPSPPTQPAPGMIESTNKPTAPAPKFRVYRSKLDEGTSVVVPPSTSDEELQSLLWLFREKVRSHRFTDIGISQPTSRRWGKNGYLAGFISIYRVGRCAGENFAGASLGPCGYGDHSAAVYQWGLLVNGVFDPDADSAGINASDGGKTEVFSYKDHWQLPAELKSKIELERSSQETSDGVNRATFAEELERQLKAAGFDLTVLGTRHEVRRVGAEL